MEYFVESVLADVEEDGLPDELPASDEASFNLHSSAAVDDDDDDREERDAEQEEMQYAQERVRR